MNLIFSIFSADFLATNRGSFELTIICKMFVLRNEFFFAKSKWSRKTKRDLCRCWLAIEHVWAYCNTRTQIRRYYSNVLRSCKVLNVHVCIRSIIIVVTDQKTIRFLFISWKKKCMWNLWKWNAAIKTVVSKVMIAFGNDKSTVYSRPSHTIDPKQWQLLAAQCEVIKS